MTNPSSPRPKTFPNDVSLLPVGLMSGNEAPSYEYRSNRGPTTTARVAGKAMHGHHSAPYNFRGVQVHTSRTPTFIAPSKQIRLALPAPPKRNGNTPHPHTLPVDAFAQICEIALGRASNDPASANSQPTNTRPDLNTSLVEIRNVWLTGEHHLALQIEVFPDTEIASAGLHFIQLDRNSGLPTIIHSCFVSSSGQMLVEVPDHDRLMPIVIICSDMAGTLDSCAILPFPSLLDLKPRSDEPSPTDAVARPAAADALSHDSARGHAEISEFASGHRSVSRILLVANGIIPTLQLSFLKPLKSLMERNLLIVSTITSEDFKKSFPKNSRSPQAVEWLLEQLDAAAPDVIIFCRYNGLHAPIIRDYAASHRIPVVFHIDDDLLNVPIEVGAEKYRWHNSKERLETIQYLLDNADLVYCSTRALADRFRFLGIRSRMEYGNIYCASEIIAPAVARKCTKVGYMGFDHAKDLDMIVEALVVFLDERPDLSFELFGSIPIPDRLIKFGDRIRVHATVRGYEEFLKYFSTLEWDIGIAPLVNSLFNTVKANTKWVEYTSVGVAVIASAGTVYDHCCDEECGILASGIDEWLAALRKLADSDEDRLALVTNAQQKLRDSYAVDNLRHQVMDMIRIAQDVVGTQ